MGDGGEQQHDTHNDGQQEQGHNLSSALTIVGGAQEQSTANKTAPRHGAQQEPCEHGGGYQFSEMAHQPAQALTGEQGAQATRGEGCTEQPRHEHQQQLKDEQRESDMWKILFQMRNEK